MQTLYTATASATAGRDGKISAEDPPLALNLAMPKALGGPGGAGTNPEQLFAAGYAACFGSAVKLVAGLKKLAPTSVTIVAKVAIGKEGQGFKLAVELVGKLPGLSKDQAMDLMKAAHEVCPYSNATRGNIDVALAVG